MNKARDLYNKHMHLVKQKVAKEVKQFYLEEHLRSHPTDYVSVIANELIKSDIHRIEYELKQVARRMEANE